MKAQRTISAEIRIPAGGIVLDGELIVPNSVTEIVIFAHGSGSSRFSPRNRFVAETIRACGLGTLLFDLLTADEEAAEMYTRHLRFDIELLTGRLIEAANFLEASNAAGKKLGFFGSSTGGAAAITAAAELGDRVSAVVSRGGRPDLAGTALTLVTAPTLLIVGERDEAVVDLNAAAFEMLRCEKRMEVIPGATHLFEEPGALEQVAEIASAWFAEHLEP